MMRQNIKKLKNRMKRSLGIIKKKPIILVLILSDKISFISGLFFTQDVLFREILLPTGTFLFITGGLTIYIMFLSDKDAEKIFKKFDERKELLIEIKEATDNLGTTLTESLEKTLTESLEKTLATPIDNLTKAINNLSGGNKVGLENTETKK